VKSVSVGLNQSLFRAASDPSEWENVVIAIRDEISAVAVDFFVQTLGKIRTLVPHNAAVRSRDDVVPPEDIFACPNGMGESSREAAYSEPSGKLVCGRSGSVQAASLPVCCGTQAVVARRHGRIFLIGACLSGESADVRETGHLAQIAQLVRLAIEANFLLLSLRLDVAVARAGIGTDSAAIFLISTDGGLLYGNARAEALLARGDEVDLTTTGRLRFRDSELEARVEAGLHGPRQQAEALLADRRSGPRALVLSVDMAVSADWQRGPIWAALGPHLVVALAPYGDQTTSAEELAQRLGLSRKEAEVALALWEGRTIAEIAAARGLSVHTLRNQVKSALAKTGARRQMDLVALVEQVRRGG
jgi:DNA-binding CsgD family transcriptional regulator